MCSSAGAMLLCLDDEAPVSRSECSYLWLHGMNPEDGDKKPCNRWFDKSIQIIVTKNGKAGLLGEHTMMDGMPMVGFAEHVAKHSHEDAVKGSSTYSGGDPPGGVENIFPSAIDEVFNSATVHQMLGDGTFSTVSIFVARKPILSIRYCGYLEVSDIYVLLFVNFSISQQSISSQSSSKLIQLRYKVSKDTAVISSSRQVFHQMPMSKWRCN